MVSGNDGDNVLRELLCSSLSVRDKRAALPFSYQTLLKEIQAGYYLAFLASRFFGGSGSFSIIPLDHGGSLK